MAASLKDFRDQIILDANIGGSANFGDPRLLRIINLAQRYVQAQLNGLGFKKWETSRSVTLFNSFFAGTAIKTFGMNNLPNMLESPRSIFFMEVSDGISHGIALPKDPIEFRDNIMNKYSLPSIKDSIFIRLANNIYLAPSTITGAVVYYYKTINDLSESSLTVTGAIVSTDDGLGDVDGDGIITMNDVELIMQAAIGNIVLTDAQKEVADLNGDDAVTGADATALLAKVGQVVNQLGWVSITTSTDHELTDGDVVEISGVTGMTDLNATFQVKVPSPKMLVVPLVTTQTYTSGGVITVNSQIPMEFEDFVIRKAVLDIDIANNKISDKQGALGQLDNDITKVFEKFYGTIQNEDFNRQIDRKKLQ
ncbi:MAG: ubiquitin-activating E1 FCCH domain-containing protein [Candidatus Paceibacterota bacterium]|jgi:hypothetical protein